MIIDKKTLLQLYCENLAKGMVMISKAKQIFEFDPCR